MQISIKGIEKIDKLYQELDNVVVTPEEIVKYGYPLAKKLAPRAKDKLGGGTKKAIKKEYYNKKTHCALVLYQPMIRPNIREYHMWMHGESGPNIAKYIKTGKPRFMFITAEKMQDYMLDNTLTNINKIK